MAAYNYPYTNATDADKRLVWNKGREIPNFDASEWRWDKCGTPMQYSKHGDTTSKYGWEIDHIRPVAQQGSDYLDNLQPLQWENNRAKADSLYWNCGR